MKKSILFILTTFYISLSFSQSKLADILFSNFEYKTAAKVYSESQFLNNTQLKNYAYSHYLVNDFQKSIPIFKLALEKNPADFQLKLRLGIALKSTGRYQSSKKYLMNYHC